MEKRASIQVTQKSAPAPSYAVLAKDGSHKGRFRILADDGTDTGATFEIETFEGEQSIRFHSRGTTAGTRAYRAGLVLLLDRLTDSGIVMSEICVDTRTTKALSRSQRRIFPKLDGEALLNDLVRRVGSEQVRKTLNTEAAKVGRPPNAKGGGNGTKQLRIYVPNHLHFSTIAHTVAMGKEF